MIQNYLCCLTVNHHFMAGVELMDGAKNYFPVVQKQVTSLCQPIKVINRKFAGSNGRIFASV